MNLVALVALFIRSIKIIVQLISAIYCDDPPGIVPKGSRFQQMDPTLFPSATITDVTKRIDRSKHQRFGSILRYF